MNKLREGGGGSSGVAAYGGKPLAADLHLNLRTASQMLKVLGVTDVP